MESISKHFTAIELVRYIATDYVETVPEKIQEQRDAIVKLCREWVEQHEAEVKAAIAARELSILRKRSEMLVVALCGAEVAPKWWESRNRAFDMETPEDTWKKDPTQVYKYLMNQSDYSI